MRCCGRCLFVSGLRACPKLSDDLPKRAPKMTFPATYEAIWHRRNKHLCLFLCKYSWLKTVVETKNQTRSCIIGKFGKCHSRWSMKLSSETNCFWLGWLKNHPAHLLIGMSAVLFSIFLSPNSPNQQGTIGKFGESYWLWDSEAGERKITNKAADTHWMICTAFLLLRMSIFLLLKTPLPEPRALTPSPVCGLCVCLPATGTAGGGVRGEARPELPDVPAHCHAPARQTARLVGPREHETVDYRGRRMQRITARRRGCPQAARARPILFCLCVYDWLIFVLFFIFGVGEKQNARILQGCCPTNAIQLWIMTSPCFSWRSSAVP